MRGYLVLFWHLLVVLEKLSKQGGARAVVAETLLMKQQLIVVARSQQRAPRFRVSDRFLLGFLTLFLNPARIVKNAVIIKPSTLLRFHRALVKRKYQRLFSVKSRKKPGPKGPSSELVAAIVEMKKRNPRFGCPRIAAQVNLAFGTDINKDVVRRVLERYYHPAGGNGGPSWLAFLGSMKDSLWSIDLFRCESIGLRSHWVLLVMDQYSRRIIGFSAIVGDVDGPTLCRVFNPIISQKALPKRLSMDNDPLFRYHRWKANLRILDIEPIKSVSHVPVSHPFVERLIGTVRREYLDRTLFWNTTDLKRKLTDFQHFYNQHRAHTSLDGKTPQIQVGDTEHRRAKLDQYSWKSHCHGLFQLPIPA